MNESEDRGKTNMQPVASPSAFCANTLFVCLLFGVIPSNGVVQQSFGRLSSLLCARVAFFVQTTLVFQVQKLFLLNLPQIPVEDAL